MGLKRLSSFARTIQNSRKSRQASQPLPSMEPTENRGSPKPQAKSRTKLHRPSSAQESMSNLQTEHPKPTSMLRSPMNPRRLEPRSSSLPSFSARTSTSTQPREAPPQLAEGSNSNLATPTLLMILMMSLLMKSLVPVSTPVLSLKTVS